MKHNAMCTLRNIGSFIVVTETERSKISDDYIEDLEQLDKKRDFEGFDKIVELFRKVNTQTQDEGAKGGEVASIDLAG